MAVVHRLGFKRSTVMTYHHQFLVTHRSTPLRSRFDFWDVIEEKIDNLSRKTGVPAQFLWERTNGD